MALYSHSLPVYTNEAAFLAEVAQIGDVDTAKHFYIIQDKYITTKYRLLDYSICLFIAGMLSMLVATVGFSNLASPKNKAAILSIGAAAVGLSILAYYGDAVVQITRELTPPWSPSTLPSTETLKKVLYFLLTWLGVHSVVLRKDFHTHRRFSSLTLDYISLGLLSSTIIAGGFALITIVGGQPIYVIPSLLWFYFHVSLLAGKQSTRRME